MNILIYNSGGGLGDCIRLFELIISLQKRFKNSEIYYLGAHENHFLGKLKEYNISIKNIDLDLKYFGFRWWHLLKARNKFKKKYNFNLDIIIDIQSKLRNTLILKRIPSKLFYSSTSNFLFTSLKKDYLKGNYDLENILINLEKITETKIPKVKYDINNINIKYFNEAKKLLPNDNYIGFSLTQGNEYRKKTWSIEKFINLANKLNNKIPVFFLGKDNLDLINKIKSNVKNSLFPELETNLNNPALVTALATRLTKAISIDNGVMHMIGLANIPMIVLFGPTNSTKFAPNINNIKILDSKKIHKTADINSIKEEEVLSLI